MLYPFISPLNFPIIIWKFRITYLLMNVRLLMNLRSSTFDICKYMYFLVFFCAVSCGVNDGGSGVVQFSGTRQGTFEGHGPVLPSGREPRRQHRPSRSRDRSPRVAASQPLSRKCTPSHSESTLWVWLTPRGLEFIKSNRAELINLHFFLQHILEQADINRDGRLDFQGAL